MGEEYFQEIAEVNLVRDPFTPRSFQPINNAQADELLLRLTRLTNLKVVLLTGSQATDQGLRYLSEMSSLERLTIWDASEITDAGVADLETLENLTHIHINNSNLTDEALASLAKHPKLAIVSGIPDGEEAFRQDIPAQVDLNFPTVVSFVFKGGAGACGGVTASPARGRAWIAYLGFSARFRATRSRWSLH